MSLIVGDMGYTEKLQKLCALRNLDQTALAVRVGLSKSSISRILSGAQEPKLRLAYDLAKALGVTLDYLVDDSSVVGAAEQLVMVTEDELTVLKMVRRLGVDDAIDRLLNVGLITPRAGESRGPTDAESPALGNRSEAARREGT